MICPKCSTKNDDDYIFCVNCGESIGPAGEKTEQFPSVATMVGAAGLRTSAPPTAQFTPPATETRRDHLTIPPTFDHRPAKGSSAWWKIAGIAVFLIVIAGGALIAAVVYFNRPVTRSEVLPDHLGLFAVDPERRLISELAKREFANVKEGRDAMLKEPIAPSVQRVADFVLYADPGDTKIDDLKFVRLDSIKDEGSMQQIDFQASLVEGKPAMKRLRFANALSNGKYAFAVFNGPFDEGKHKFWAFEVNGISNADTATAGHELTIALKEKKPDEKQAATNASTETQKIEKPAVEAPIGARIAYCNASDVVVRGAPSLTARKVNGLRRGQKVYLLSYSDNYDDWNGVRANWAYIQTEGGKRGWVFTPFISY